MISSYNEWDPLRKIMVGSATHANWPGTDPVYSQEYTRTTWTETPVPAGPVPDHIVEEANTDLEILANCLENLGVEVIRPSEMNFVQYDGMYNYCPRDRLLVYGDTVVDCAMMYPCRDMEIAALWEVTESAGRVIQMPRNQGLVLDAANVCRMGDTWLFLESFSGNRAAYQWLCEQFPEVDIELCNFYAGVHIDSTIVPLREGLVLLNGSRVNPENCPAAFDTWQKIYIDDVVPQSFYQYPYASKWIAMNMLVVDPETVIVDSQQHDLITTLLAQDFNVIPMTLRHSRTLGGGFHCVTLDLVRETTK
jgi:glycine amidinotransferase/scyllo-inosamine-4-phosphate amidinotransferase 1